MSDYPTRIELCESKYSVILDFRTGDFKALRHGNEWRSLTGDKLILAMFDRIVELEAANQVLTMAASVGVSAIGATAGGVPATSESATESQPARTGFAVSPEWLARKLAVADDGYVAAGAPSESAPQPDAAVCSKCGKPWLEHEFAVPAPYCP